MGEHFGKCTENLEKFSRYFEGISYKFLREFREEV